MAAGGTWPESALTLAIPRASGEQSLRILGRLLADHLWSHFDNAVEGLARDMDAAARLAPAENACGPGCSQSTSGPSC
ncbi:hypothetical protein ACIRS3_15685 [Streptomyces virginiae]|uniref:hypothetical protein n=1 Tax=Streptomyces virginiae TaxID=1961 RepID=UPI00381E9CE1